MEKIKIFYDKMGNTLNVWFDDPSNEAFCEEASGEIILIKDVSGKVIGFEKLNFIVMKKDQEKVSIPVEVMMS